MQLGKGLQGYSFVLSAVLGTGVCQGGLPASMPIDKDPHYNEIGFFDMHLCNWPDRPKFFKVVFSTKYYDKVTSIEVFRPDGKKLVSLSKDRFISLKKNGKVIKRVFLADIDVPEDAPEGWYYAETRGQDGRVHTAQDYMLMTRIRRASGQKPEPGAEDVPMPSELSWDRVPGAKYYQVYLRDAWTDKLLYRSKLAKENRVAIKDGMLEPGGYYYWTIHARDVNEHVLLGDFHNGSMSDKSYFTVAE